MAAAPRILTFNFHEPYLCLMAKTGLHFFVGEYDGPPLARAWQLRYRPIPPNLSFLKESVWMAEAAEDKFDVIIAHNETNALSLRHVRSPKFMVCHNRKTFLYTTASVEKGDAKRLYDKLVHRLQQTFTFVFISESKRADYGLPGLVIPPGIDVEEYGGYSGAVPEVIRVGNAMRDRTLMFDVDFQERVCEGIPNRVVGDNAGIPGAQSAGSFDELRELYRTRRCLLHVTREEWEDGYNLSTLEAMACGMPVVSLANRTSPLTDGVDGFLSYDADVLRARLRELLKNPELARAIGARGRDTVARKFPIAAFVDKWREAIENAAARSTRLSVRSTPHKKGPAFESKAGTNYKILMHYLASPLTTGRYFERAARKHHAVITAGFRCPEEVLELWGFDGAPPEYAPHAIDLPLKHTYREIAARLPAGFAPDLYLWVDSGPKEVPPDIEAIGGVKAGYLIDTHIAPELRLAMARHFDYTFLAQKAQVPDFIAAGIRNVTWIPLACSPELHETGPLDRIYDVAFICNPQGDHTDRRRNIMETIAKRFPNSRTGRFWPEQMARIYAQSKIVVNACVNRDVNMRVFEALASGALLITDEADGLEDLFDDGKHLVVYRRDEDLGGLIERHLADAESRETIAAAGCALVYEKHTYDVRMDALLAIALAGRGGTATLAGESKYQDGGYYRNTRPEVAQYLPRTARRVLDVGCGAGDFGRAIKRRGRIEVVGIELDAKACAMAAQVLDKSIEGNIETMTLPFADGYFDCIVFADVLEHLVDPQAVLRKAARVLAPDGVILMSLPNVGYYEVVQMLANGRWKYEDAGIMDRTHLRFFTAAEVHALIAGAGLDPLVISPLSFIPESQVPLEPGGTVKLHRVTIGPLSSSEYQNLRTYQFFAVAGKHGGDRLAKARQVLEARNFEAAYLAAQEAFGVNECQRRHIMGRAMARLGRLDVAENLFREAIALEPDAADSRSALGVLLVAMNRSQEAMPLLETAIEKRPDDSRALGALGLAHIARGDFDKAFDFLRRALDADFEHAALVPHLIEAARQLHRLEGIEETVRRFADFYPGDAGLAHACAALLAELGKIDAAKARLEAVLMLDPNHAPSRQLLDSLIERG